MFHEKIETSKFKKNDEKKQVKSTLKHKERQKNLRSSIQQITDDEK